MSVRPATLVLLDRFLGTRPVDAALERIEEALWSLVGWSETLRSALVDQESAEVLEGAASSLWVAEIAAKRTFQECADEITRVTEEASA